jgi:hypothetical protein
MKTSARLALGPIALLMGSLGLLGQVAGMPTPEASNNTDVASLLEPRILSGCQQGACPDYHAAFDGLVKHREGPGTHYRVRWNQCGQCGQIFTNGDMCVDFASCGKQQRICIDRGNKRAHWIRKTGYQRWCFYMEVIEDYCNWDRPRQWLFVPREAECNW